MGLHGPKVEMISRRKFLIRWLGAFFILILGMVLRPFSKGWADTDPFVGTDFVGKTRAGDHESFYIKLLETHAAHQAGTVDAGGRRAL